MAAQHRSGDGRRPGSPRRPPAGEHADPPERPRPFRARDDRPRRPPLPDERPVVPRDAWRDLRATVPANVLDDVVKAVGAAAEALQAGDFDRATGLLAWAKSVASRTPTIREALGIAHYAAGRYSQAHSELLAYRRLSGKHDQNHLLADCARAAGRHDKVVEYVEQMQSAGVDEERVVEGLMVLAGERADSGDLDGAVGVLQRVGLDPDEIRPWQARVWYLAADLHERLGRRDEAREYFEAILAVDEDYADAAQRLTRLEDAG